jgi:membrane-associated phospholipid phosphatase
LYSGVAGIGGGFAKVNGNQDPFALTDLSISYPYQLNETVSTALLVVIGLVIPAAIVLFGSLLIVPTPTALRGTPSALIWRSKLWEWNAGWLGLGVALAGAFMSTEGLKDLAGKPRPDFLARCDPDVTQVGAYMVSGLGKQVLNAPILVTVGICRNKGSTVTNDGFASFPSGHSSCKLCLTSYM